MVGALYDRLGDIGSSEVLMALPQLPVPSSCRGPLRKTSRIGTEVL